MNDEVYTVKVNNEEQGVTLADLAGIDMSEVEEYRGGGITPEGVYEWQVVSATLDKLSFLDKKSGENVTAPIIDIKLRANACLQCKDPGIDPVELVGIEFNERFFIRDAIKDIGKIKAFMSDIGFTGSGSLGDQLDQLINMEFTAAVKHRKNNNDPDRPYANLDNKTIKPLGGLPDAAPAAAAGGGVAGLRLNA